MNFLNIHILVRDWKILIDYCNDKSKFDSSFFKMIHEDYARKYKKCTDNEQGEICYLISIDYENRT